MKSKKAFPQELLTPIKWSGPSHTPFNTTDPAWGTVGLLGYWNADKLKHHEEQVAKAWSKVFEKRAAKLVLLCKFFNVDQSYKTWPTQLSLSLAIYFVRGFQVDFADNDLRRLSRKRKWDSDAFAKLLVDIEKIKKEKRTKSDMHAATVLVERGRAGRDGYAAYKPRTRHSKKAAANSLATRLNEARLHVFPLMGSSRSPRSNPEYRRFVETLARIYSPASSSDPNYRHLFEKFAKAYSRFSRSRPNSPRK